MPLVLIPLYNYGLGTGNGESSANSADDSHNRERWIAAKAYMILREEASTKPNERIYRRYLDRSSFRSDGPVGHCFVDSPLL
jgi:hypothetical protein